MNKPVIRFQALLGFAVLAAVGLLAWSHISGLGFEERPVRAREQARELARATLDFRADTGHWPLDSEGEIGLTPLLGTGSSRTATALAAGAPSSGLGGLSGSGAVFEHHGAGISWLGEIPLDPWGQPYEVMQAGKAVAVLSTGPNRKLDTDPKRIWSRPGNINPCDGDDVGIVLEIEN